MVAEEAASKTLGTAASPTEAKRPRLPRPRDGRIQKRRKRRLARPGQEPEA